VGRYSHSCPTFVDWVRLFPTDSMCDNKMQGFHHEGFAWINYPINVHLDQVGILNVC
jgi:hypothetical protein